MLDTYFNVGLCRSQATFEMHLILKVYQSNFHLSGPKMNTFFYIVKSSYFVSGFMQSVFFPPVPPKFCCTGFESFGCRSVNAYCRYSLTNLPVVAHATGERKDTAKQTNRWKATFWFGKYIHHMTAYIYEGLSCILPLIYHTKIFPYLHAKIIQQTRLKLLPIWGEIGKWIFSACPWTK